MKPTGRSDSAKRTINMNQIMTRELNAFYRESQKPLSSDSGESSGHNSICNDSYYQDSVEDIHGVRIGNQNSREEIAERLSKLKISGNRNVNRDSGTVHDLPSDNNHRSDSIIAGKSPADIHHTSVQSIPDYKYSLVLAGRLESKDDSSSYVDEESLLNIAINESVETDLANPTNNADSLQFVDSLEARKEEISTCNIYGRDSLEAVDYCDRNKSQNEKKENFLFNNNENVNPNLLETKHRGQPRIICDEMVKLPIKSVKQMTKKMYGKPNSKGCVSKNVFNSSNSSAIDRFNSLMSESERLVIADIKTPKVKNIMFIGDCVKSSPEVGINFDTFGSDLVADITNLSTLGEGDIELDGKNAETDDCRNQIFKRFSQQFTTAPTKFTEKLLSIVEGSVLGNTRTENPNISGVSLDRLTEEFRKICRAKRIEDESMPSQLFDITNFSNLEGTHNVLDESTGSLPFHNFTQFGRGKKVYPRTPRSIFNSNNSRTYCTTPNCGNAWHRVKNKNLCSPEIGSPAGEADILATFEFLENLFYEASPTRQSKTKLLNVDVSGIPSHGNLSRQSDQLMAALDESFAIVTEVDKKEKSDVENKKSTTNSKESQHHCNSIRQKLTENFRDVKQGHTYNEIEEILAARLVEKRRKCFEEASKAVQSKVKGSENGTCELVDEVSKDTNKIESSKERDNEARFISTLSACADYFDHFKSLQNHRTSLQCIMECSENSESTREAANDSQPIKYVNTVTLHVQNCENHESKEPEHLTPKNKNPVVKTCLYIPGTLRTSGQRSPKRHCRLSPIRRLSPGAQPSTVLSKKIKSPAPSARKRSILVVQPSNVSRPESPSITSEDYILRVEQNSFIKSGSRCPSSNKLKLTSNNSPSLMDVTNTKKRFDIPKCIVTNASPSFESLKRSCRSKNTNENMDLDCQRQLDFTGTETPESKKSNKYFYTPGKTPMHNKAKPKKKFFETPGGKLLQNKILTPSPGSYRVNYNTVQSPVGMYIRGTDPNLIKNVKGKTNDRMLTPRSKSSKSKCPSPILARSPRLSPISTESSRLKFQLTPSRRQRQSKQCDIFNIALCESDPSSEIGSETTTSHSPFPKIFYNPAPCVKMVNDNQPHRNPKILAPGMEEKIIYRHNGRLKSAKELKVQNFLTEDESTKDGFSPDSGDISLLHERPTVKSNYLLRK